MAVTFACELWADAKHEFDALGAMNFAECGIAEGMRPYSLNHALFDWAETQDMVNLTTARQGGKLVGYVLSIITPRHIQYEACCSQQIGMFLHPDYRKGSIGIKLMQEDEENLRKRGVQKLYGGFTMDKDLGALFRRRGWKLTEVHYSKWIGL